MHEKTKDNAGIIAKAKWAQLFLSFLRLGLSAFGGPATIAYIRALAVDKKQWISKSAFQRGLGLCQSIPGATAMQVSAYVGLRVGGFFGALASFVGFGLPSFFLMLALTIFYQQAHDIGVVLAAFKGLQVIVIALVANAVLSFGQSTIKKWQDAFLALAAAGFLLAQLSPIAVILAAALLGLLFYKSLEVDENIRQKQKVMSFRRNFVGPLILLLVLGIGLGLLYLFDQKLFDLATLMLKVDLFAFGGGYASVPVMLHEVVGVRHWMDSQTFMAGIALGQVTPGPIVITATFVGYLLAGWFGAVVGSISVFTPSLLILLGIVPYFDRLQHNAPFQKALRGVLASFVGLLLAVGLQFCFVVHWSPLALIIALLAFVALRLKVDILWVVLVGAGLSAFLL